MAASPLSKSPVKASMTTKDTKTTFSKSSSVSSQKSVDETIHIAAGISLVLKTGNSPPPKGALCLGEQKTDLAGDGKEKKLWSVICDGAEYGHGKYPGYATKDEAFYSYKGQDYGVKKFYWIVLDFDTHLEVHKGGEPPLNRLMIKDAPFYLICGRHENHGIIPGYFNEEKQAVYAYGGKEFKAKEFLWVIADSPVEAFRLLKQDEEIPVGWRLATTHDVTKFQVDARCVITEEWAMCQLADGKISGKGYEFKVEHGTFNELGFKLIAKYGHGPLHDIGWVWFNNWIGTEGSKLTRKEEKAELQVLNNRLAGYIDKVRGDSMKSCVQIETSSLKKRYDQQADDLKKALDDIYRNFFLSNSKLRVEMEAMIRQNEELKWKLERKDMHLKNSMLRVNALEEDIRKLGNDLDREQHSHGITQLKVTELMKEIEMVQKRMKDERDHFNGQEEIIAKLEFRNKELESEVKGLKVKLTVDVEEHVEVVVEKQKEIESIKKELDELRARYDLELKESRIEFKKHYEDIIAGLKLKIETVDVKVVRSEALEAARKTIEELTIQIGELNKQLDLAKLEKDKNICDEVTIYKTQIAAKDDEIKAVLAKLEAQIKQYQQLQEVKIALDMEIAVFRRLLENEEDRLNLSIDVEKKSKRRSKSSRSSSSSSSDGEEKGKKKVESWGSGKVEGQGTAGYTVRASKTTVVSQTVSQSQVSKKSKN